MNSFVTFPSITFDFETEENFSFCFQDDTRGNYKKILLQLISEKKWTNIKLDLKIFTKRKREASLAVWLENIFLLPSRLINKARPGRIVAKKAHLCRFSLFLSIDCLVALATVVLPFRTIYLASRLFSWNKWLFIGFNLWYYHLLSCHLDVNCLFSTVYIYTGCILIWFLARLAWLLILFPASERYFSFVLLK